MKVHSGCRSSSESQTKLSTVADQRCGQVNLIRLHNAWPVMCTVRQSEDRIELLVGTVMLAGQGIIARPLMLSASSTWQCCVHVDLKPVLGVWDADVPCRLFLTFPKESLTLVLSVTVATSHTFCSCLVKQHNFLVM